MSQNVSIDTHIHLAGTGCGASGCWMSASLRKRYTIRILQLMHGIKAFDLDHTIDQDWGERITTLVEQSCVDFGVILGFDGAATPQGGQDELKSQLVIPDEWVFSLCKQYKNLLPGPSINPHLSSAMERLERCIEQKAVLIKWIPSAQLINPSSVDLKPFYRRLQEAGIPLLIHCGGERTFKSFEPSLNDVVHLFAPLEQGVKVICAHSATKVIGSKDLDQVPQLKKMIKQFPNLWVDNSGLCNPSRFAHVPRLAQDPIIQSRTIYGSDWPVPVNSFYFAKKIGVRKVLEFERQKNWISRDVAIKRYFGYPDETLTRGQKVLANLNFWCADR